MANEAKKAVAGWLNLVIDYGPLAVFFAVYWAFAPADKSDSIGVILAVVRSTGAFIVAALVALAGSMVVFGVMSRLMLLWTVLFVVLFFVCVLLRYPF